MVKFALVFAVFLSSTAVAMAQSDDVEAGAALFQRRCQVCHAIGEGAANKVGPPLNGVVGAPIANLADFSLFGRAAKCSRCRPGVERR